MKIFITYNSNRGKEETHAIRMSTVLYAHGIISFLPYRWFYTNDKKHFKISKKTKNQILDSDFLIYWTAHKTIHPVIKEEINLFNKLKKRVYIIDINNNTKIDIQDKILNTIIFVGNQLFKLSVLSNRVHSTS